MYERLSPIQRMIDAACSHKSEDNVSQEPRLVTSYDKEVARTISRGAIDHITTMYPNMLKGVPSTARTSLRNHIYNTTLSALVSYPPPIKVDKND